MSNSIIKTLPTHLLHQGDKIQNYKALCELLDQPVFGGLQKKKQLQEFQRFFLYEKLGHKFLILEIFDEPLPAEEYMAHNSKYVQFIQNILLSYLVNSPEEENYISRSYLYRLLGLINKHYYTYYPEKQRKRLLSLDENIKIEDIDDFYSRCDTKIAKILNDSLKSLERRFLLEAQPIYLIGMMTMTPQGESLIFHCSSDEEIKYILRVRHEELSRLGLESTKEFIFPWNRHKRELFYLNTQGIFKTERNWDTVSRGYKFIYNKDHVISALRSSMNREESVRELNSIVAASINQQAIKRHEQEKAKYRAAIGDIEKFMRYGDRYVLSQSSLTNKLIKL